MEMIDYLLKFNTKQEAIVFAEQMGFTTDVEDGNGIEVTIPMTQSDTHVFTVIGEHFMPTGKTETIRDESGMEWQTPKMKGDKKHWVQWELTPQSQRCPTKQSYCTHILNKTLLK